MSSAPSRPHPLDERIMRADNGCLIWLGARNDDGYGVIRRPGSGRGHGDTRPQQFDRAHVVAWERKNGPVPDGHVLEHACHTADLTCEGGPTCWHRACVDETHLRPVTPLENHQLGVAHRRAREEQAA
jgi:hypothetical protein